MFLLQIEVPLSPDRYESPELSVDRSSHAGAVNTSMKRLPDCGVVEGPPAPVQPRFSAALQRLASQALHMCPHVTTPCLNVIHARQTVPRGSIFPGQYAIN